MFEKLLNNISNKLRRSTNKLSYNRKNKVQHSHFRRDGDVDLNDEKAKSSHLKWLPSWIKISPKYILYFLTFSIFIALGYQLFLIITAWTNFQTQQYPNQSITEKIEDRENWQGKTKLTILLVATDKVDEEHVFVDAIGIYNIDPVDNKLSVFIINPDLKVYVAAVGKDVNLRTVFNDPKLPGDRTTILKKAVAALLAIRIDRYILVEKTDFSKYSNYLNPLKLYLKSSISDSDIINLPGKKLKSWDKGDQVINNNYFLEFLASDSNGENDQLERQQDFLAALPFSQLTSLTLIKLPDLISRFSNTFFTDLSKDELLSIIKGFVEIKESNIKKGYTKSNSFEKVNTTSFYPVFTPMIDRIDQDINNIFFDLKIFKEHARIEVLNVSDVKGLANSRARWIANLGARIIKVGNGFGSSVNTKIYCTEPEKFPYTINELNRIFNFKAELINQDYPNRHIGDIIIELGSTYE